MCYHGYIRRVHQMSKTNSRYHSGSIVKHHKGGEIYQEGRFYYAVNCLGEFLGYQATMLDAILDINEDEKERNSAEVII
jgi:hypothetical protein